MTKALIISRYKENIDYVNNINFDIIKYLYNKNKDNIQESIKLPNIGRESHTFLYHIVNNYDNLADLNIFIQGNPFDHCPYFLNFINNNIDNKLIVLGIEWFEDDGCGYPHHYGLEINRVLNEISGDKINNFPFSVGAQYSIPKSNILFYSKNFYQKLYDLHFTIDQMPWIMERLWYLIWQNKINERK